MNQFRLDTIDMQGRHDNKMRQNLLDISEMQLQRAVADEKHKKNVADLHAQYNAEKLEFKSEIDNLKLPRARVTGSISPMPVTSLIRPLPL